MTVLMPSWYYEKKDLKRTPSILGGLDMERESRYRREGARFIINVGTKMGLRYDTMATGVVYFHRFYMFHSFRTFPRYVTACCCLFLAGKVEETPKKCKDIIRVARTFLQDNQFAQFGDDPKEEVMTLERILLQTIKFDLQVDHPYGHLIKYAKCLKGDKTKLQNMVQMAWTFINDSLCTTLCLQWEPEVIAIALMYLAGKLSKFEVIDWVGRLPKHTHWWDMFVEGMSIELLEDICHQVLDLYAMPIPNTPQDSPPATPPTKSTRKSSQPPSPVEISNSPAQPKLKDVSLGQPIPRLEPGELKRKVPPPDIKKEVVDTKAARVVEPKSNPTVSYSPKTAPAGQGHDTQPSSPVTPKPVDITNKNIKQAEIAAPCVTAADAVFKPSIVSTTHTTLVVSTVTETAPVVTVVTKPVAPAPVTTISVTVAPPTSTFTQSSQSYYSTVGQETQPYPNLQQPPPPIYPQRPVQFQHPPPPVPSGPPPPTLCPPTPHQYPPSLPPAGMPPPFNSQYPPPRHQPPPNIINNPPPSAVPNITSRPPPPPPHSQRMPPVSGMMQPIHHPPPGVPPRGPPPPIIPDNMYRPRPASDLFNPHHEHRGVHPPPDSRAPNHDFRPRLRFENEYPGPQGRRDSELNAPFQRDVGYHRPGLPNQFGPNFERMPPPRHYLDPQAHRKLDRGPPPPGVGNAPSQQGAPTGIPPVRITGSL